jgi:hypothetical protein
LGVTKNQNKKLELASVPKKTAFKKTPEPKKSSDEDAADSGWGESPAHPLPTPAASVFVIKISAFYLIASKSVLSVRLLQRNSFFHVKIWGNLADWN